MTVASVGSSDPTAFVGRHAERARIDEFVASLAQGPAALLLEGEAGIGKTTLFRAGIDALGFRTVISHNDLSAATHAHALAPFCGVK